MNKLANILKISLILLFFISALFNCSSGSQKSGIESDSLVRTAEIILPDVHGRIDHIAYDSSTHRAFIAALGNNSLEVVDINSKDVIHTIKGLHEPQGIIYIPETNRLVVANGGDGSVIFFDASDYTILSSLNLESDADNIRFDKTTNLIYVGYGNGGIAIIDADSMQQTGNIPLDGHPESFQLDDKSNRIYINVPDKNLIEVGDLHSQKIILTWKNTSAKSNFPMAQDVKNQLLFIGDRKPAKLEIFDAKTGQSNLIMDCVSDADDIFYDDTDSLILVSGGGGFIDIFKENYRADFILINHIPTAAGARTSLWMENEKKLLLAVPAHNGENAALWIYDLVNG